MAEFLRYFEGIATLILAIYVASIGTFQWYTAREKLRLDLYNRRFDVYTQVLDYVGSLPQWGQLSYEQAQSKSLQFTKAVRESRFIFADDPTIFATLEEIQKRSINVVKLRGHLNVPVPRTEDEADYDYEAIEDEEKSDHKWITKSTLQLERLLEPYLAFGKGI